MIGEYEPRKYGWVHCPPPHRLTESTKQLAVCAFHAFPIKVTYDPSIEDCVSGKVVPRTSTTEFTPTEEVLKDENCDEDRISPGYKCCGPEKYHPDFQTCCQEMTKTKVHHNSPEKKYVCCGTEIYSRTNPECRHLALNDRLWDTHPRVDKRAIEVLCNANYVYRIRVIPKTNRTILRPLKPNGEILKLSFKKDKYTPTTRLPKKGKKAILLATQKDLSKVNEFIATSRDIFYTVKKVRKFRKNFLQRRCKSLEKTRNKLH